MVSVPSTAKFPSIVESPKTVTVPVESIFNRVAAVSASIILKSPVESEISLYARPFVPSSKSSLNPEEFKTT